MEHASRSTLTNVSEQIVNAVNNTATQFASHTPGVAASGLPIAAVFGFVPGLMMWVQEGLEISEVIGHKESEIRDRWQMLHNGGT
jgi:hypothetical protein